MKCFLQISLKRWHRHLQIFVAYFAYLNQAQLYFNTQTKVNLSGKVATYLENLRKSAQSVLCNLEYVFNSTKLIRLKMSNYIYIPSHIMKNRLKIEDQNPATLKKRSTYKGKTDSNTCIHKVTPLDLKFLKLHFLNYLRRLIKILRTHTRNYYITIKKQQKSNCILTKVL